ncbi:hypothetical protein HOC35_05590 [Candidatus Woesearchaeota archaeon]|jgi:DNA-directed RNA polymerase subunit RPC12/RpoP|nr:hypothetical protein [Candidatus Woesearchaeota archaeon]
MTEEVKATCRVCGRAANATEFVLDPYFKKMACPMCIRDRNTKVKLEKDKVQAEESAEAIRNEEDLIIIEEDKEVEQAYEEKQEQVKEEMENAVKAQKLDNSRVKYICQKCKYEFVYNFDKGTPNNCPYCSEKVQNFVAE